MFNGISPLLGNFFWFKKELITFDEISCMDNKRNGDIDIRSVIEKPDVKPEYLFSMRN